MNLRAEASNASCKQWDIYTCKEQVKHLTKMSSLQYSPPVCLFTLQKERLKRSQQKTIRALFDLHTSG
jgi:hypothetical protein